MPDLLLASTGHLAGFLTTLSFLPQVIHTWRTGSARDLSLWMLLAFFTGVALWLVYGIALGATPLIVANGVTLVLVGLLLGLKFAGMRAPARLARPAGGAI